MINYSLSYPEAYQTLVKGLANLHTAIEPEPFFEYLGLLTKWNKAYNLTAIRELDEMINLHILDSLAIHSWILGTNILDVGSGAGLPGIPLALLYKDYTITLVDSNNKKINFLRAVKRQLNLDNLTIIHTRVENYQPLTKFNTIISRAFANVELFVAKTSHLIAMQGKWLAMKGKLPLNECVHLTLPFQIEQYTVPELNSARCVVIINNEKLIPDRS